MSSNTDIPTPDPSTGSDEYRLVVYRSEDFQEIRSFNLTVSNIYVLTSVILLLLCGLVYSLMAFTPLKRLIPGYGKIEANQQFLELIDGVDDLTVKVEAQGTYIGAMRTLLGTGLADTEIGGLPDLIDQSEPKLPESATVPIRSTPQAAELVTSPTTNDIGDEDLYRALAKGKVLLPVSGLISSEFDPNIKHFGVDILAPAQTPIISIMDGIVFSSGWDLETGYTIGIQHQDNILSFYKHNSQLLKEKGTFVKAGEAVAIIGNTGTMSSGPHLHFEIWHNGKPINPQDILNFN